MALGAGDCERLHDGLIAQPVNTASALAYLAVGAWLVGQGLRPGTARRRTVGFGLAVAVAGIGSVDYHGPGSPAARLLHDGGLYAVVSFVAVHEVARRVRRAAGWTPRRRAAYLAAMAAVAAGAACWWLGRTGGPLCDPDSPLQGHAAWHLLTATALALWATAALEP